MVSGSMRFRLTELVPVRRDAGPDDEEEEADEEEEDEPETDALPTGC